MLRVVRSVAELRAACEQARSRGERVGFVPTMGALHAGHLALVAEARRRAELVVSSIFVNPTQFGPGEDFTRYPRDLEGDVRKLEGAGAGLVFAPGPDEMYPAGDDTRVSVRALTTVLDGVHRPGHFEGVATVVAKLFTAVGACTAVFGRKDYQQLLVVRRMATDLLMPVQIVGHPIVREPDGLALSSRNAYLSTDERARALGIVRGLQAAAMRFAAGERDARVLESVVRISVETATPVIDYVEVRDADTLAPVATVDQRAALLVACRVGSTRLIDNIVLGEDPAPLSSGSHLG